MRLKLIMNPGARSGRGRRLWQRWAEHLRGRGCAMETVLTQSLSHAMELARASRGCDAVVAVGGDGTVNAVLDGVMQAGDPELAMGVLYCGTSPDFCRFHGIPLEPDAAVEALLGGKRRLVDVGRITYGRPNGAQATAHFGCGSNIGLGAAIARMANRVRRFLGDAVGTGLAVLAALARIPPADLSAEIDGEPHPLPRNNNLSILKNPFIASGMKLNVGLRPDDGDLCAVAISGRTPAGLLQALPGFYSGRAAAAPGIWVRKCRRIVVRGPAATEVEFDGDPRGCLPVAIAILPRSLPLIGSQA